MPNASNVTTGKPKIGGAIFRAPLGTKLPTSATEELNAAFKELGYISEDGLTNSNARTSQDIKEWGGAIVDSSTTEVTDKFKFKLIEGLNVEVLKTVYGDNNVETITVGSGENEHEEIHVKANSEEREEFSWIADMSVKGGIERIVIPKAKISEVADVVYKGTEAKGFETTIAAYPDENGNSHHNYIYVK